jgi:hypothetical protein
MELLWPAGERRLATGGPVYQDILFGAKNCSLAGRFRVTIVPWKVVRKVERVLAALP